jgi:hypothetical protein
MRLSRWPGVPSNHSRILTRAEENPDSNKLLTTRLINDMKPLRFQVHYATFQAQSIAAKLSRQEYTESDNDLDTYNKMYARIQQALKALEETDREEANRRGDMATQVMRHGVPMEFPVKAVVGLWIMSNICFHVSMTYAILRKEGVPIGKRDWSRTFASEYI